MPATTASSAKLRREPQADTTTPEGPAPAQRGPRRSAVRPSPTDAAAATEAAADTVDSGPPAVVADIRRSLEEAIGPHKYRMWFGQAVLALADRTMTITVPTAYAAKWIESRFAAALRQAADVVGPGTSITIRTVETPATAAIVTAEPAAPPPPTPPRRGPALRKLGEFVIGPSNRLAHATACRLVDEPGPAEVSPLFIHGDCGVGKTHLLQGICDRFRERTGRYRGVRYVTGEQFTNEYIAAIRNNTLDGFRERVRKLDLLAIDDVHFLSNKVRTQGEFLHTIDAIDLTGARVVLASDEHPRLIKRFSQALVSRFLSGMVVEIERPDRGTRQKIIERLVAARGLMMGQPAVDLLAARCVGSIRELEGAVTKLAALKTLGHASNGTSTASNEIGVVLVEQLFRDPGFHPPVPIRLDTIIEVVSGLLAVARADLMGSTRQRRVVLGRALIAFLGREMTGHSYPEIARALGRECHSTVHTAEQRLRRQLADDHQVITADGHASRPLGEVIDQTRHEVMKLAASIYRGERVRVHSGSCKPAVSAS